jgi:mono/diheme cytochrome c family protein
MRKFARILIRLVAAVLILAVVLVSAAWMLVQRREAKQWQVSAPPIVVPDDEAAVARGRRLAMVVSMCADCHGTDLGGKVMIDNFANGPPLGRQPDARTRRRCRRLHARRLGADDAARREAGWPERGVHAVARVQVHRG